MKPERLGPASRRDPTQPMAAAGSLTGDFVVRADAVAWSGRGIVVVEERVGPSTLASQLIALGATPVARGRTVFTGHGMIRSVDRNAPPLPATLLIVTSYAPDAVWAPVVRQGAQAVLSLLERATAVRDDPQTALSLAAELASAGLVALHGSRPDAPAVARAVLECADRLSSGLPPLAALGASSRTGSGRVRLADVLGNPGWVPVAVEPRRNTIRFRRLPRPFYVAHAGTNPRPWDVELRLRAVRTAAAALPEPDRALYVYHHGYAGSTLLCRLLDTPGVCLGYDEPNVHLHHYDNRPIRALCYRTFRPGEVPLIKTVPAEIRNARRHFAEHSEARGIFLYAPLEEYVASTLRHEYRRAYVTRMARNELGVDCDDPGEAAMRCWTWIAREAAALAAAHSLRTVHASDFFEDVEGSLARIWAWFGFPPRSDWTDTLARVGAVHAKSRRPFSLAHRQAQRRAYAERARAWIAAHRGWFDAAGETMEALARFTV